jgi:hypothetical protein
MLVEDLMTVDPVIVNPDTTLADAARIMLDRHLSGLPVVDESANLVGVITEGDLLRRPELGTQGKPASWLMAFIAPARMAEGLRAYPCPPRARGYDSECDDGDARNRTGGGGRADGAKTYQTFAGPKRR